MNSYMVFFTGEMTLRMRLELTLAGMELGIWTNKLPWHPKEQDFWS